MLLLCLRTEKNLVHQTRPVSVNVNLCKVFELLVRDIMVEHLEVHKLIKGTQHGFVRNKSCLTNLLVFMEEVTIKLPGLWIPC